MLLPACSVRSHWRVSAQRSRPAQPQASVGIVWTIKGARGNIHFKQIFPLVHFFSGNKINPPYCHDLRAPTSS